MTLIVHRYDFVFKSMIFEQVNVYRNLSDICYSYQSNRYFKVRLINLSKKYEAGNEFEIIGTIDAQYSKS